MVNITAGNDFGKAEFLESFPVPRGTVHKLEMYAERLVLANKKFNLVSDSTLPSLWHRHFLDSAQLTAHIPVQTTKIIDMGSGAGLPGIVVSILCPQIEVMLIESTGKKAEFLYQIAKELELNVVVKHERIEAQRNTQAEIIMARALKPLLDLLSYAKPLMQQNSTCLFLKGQNAPVELTEAYKYWTFDIEQFPSITDSSGRLLKITNLKILRANKRH